MLSLLLKLPGWDEGCLCFRGVLVEGAFLLLTELFEDSAPCSFTRSFMDLLLSILLSLLFRP